MTIVLSHSNGDTLFQLFETVYVLTFIIIQILVLFTVKNNVHSTNINYKSFLTKEEKINIL